MFILAAL